MIAKILDPIPGVHMCKIQGQLVASRRNEHYLQVQFVLEFRNLGIRYEQSAIDNTLHDPLQTPPTSTVLYPQHVNRLR